MVGRCGVDPCVSRLRLCLSLSFSLYTLWYTLSHSLYHTHTHFLSHSHPHTHTLPVAVSLHVSHPSFLCSIPLPSFLRSIPPSSVPSLLSLPSLTHSRLVQMLVKNAKDIIDHIDEHTCCMAPAKVNGLYDIYYHVSTYIFEINMY